MTISDIAKALGISNATVSKALNGSSDISAEKRKAICDYAQSVGYRSRKARSVNGRVALLWTVPISSPLCETARSFCVAAERARYVVVEEMPGEDLELDDYLAANRLYGAFLLGDGEPFKRQLEHLRHPTVLANGYYTGNPLVAGVESDLLRGTQEAVNYLFSLGHERVAFLCEEGFSGAERFAGYVRGLLGRDVKLKGELVFWGKNCVERALETGNFTAAVCASDKLARNLCDCAGRRGINVPEELSVIGADDVHFPADPSLTAVRQNFTELGKCGFTLLENLMNGIPAHRAMIGCTLVTGESTCPPPRSEQRERIS